MSVTIWSISLDPTADSDLSDLSELSDLNGASDLDAAAYPFDDSDTSELLANAVITLAPTSPKGPFNYLTTRVGDRHLTIRRPANRRFRLRVVR